MVYPVTGSTLTTGIQAGLSTQIRIKVGTISVGALQSFEIIQDRSAAEIHEIGLDGILELVHDKPTSYSASIQRVYFDRMHIAEAFARGYLNIKSQLKAFDIEVYDMSNAEDSAEGDGVGVLTTKVVGCRFTNIRTPYQAGNFIVTESATIKFQDIQSYLPGKANAAIGGLGKIPQDVINNNSHDREKAADVGNMRGTLDIAGLIKITQP